MRWRHGQPSPLEPAEPPAEPADPAEPLTCATRSVRSLGYGAGALMVVSIAIHRRSAGRAEPLSDEQRKKFRDL